MSAQQLKCIRLLSGLGAGGQHTIHIYLRWAALNNFVDQPSLRWPIEYIPCIIVSTQSPRIGSPSILNHELMCIIYTHAGPRNPGIGTEAVLYHLAISYIRLQNYSIVSYFSGSYLKEICSHIFWASIMYRGIYI